MYLCEYLPRLSAISIVIDFPYDPSTIQNLAIQGNSLILKRNISEDETITISLPSFPQTKDSNSSLKLTNFKKTNDSLVLSIKAPENETKDNFMNLLDLQLWSCKDLLKTRKNSQNVNEFELQCKSCHQPVIKSVDFNCFSDMPSSLWVEMMDFWHCHKPHDTKVNSHSSKDYNGELTPQPNSILVGNYYFLANKNESMAANLKFDDSKVLCGCGKSLGETTSSGCVKLLKWNLILSYHNHDSQPIAEDYPPYLYVYNLMLDKINLQAIRKLSINNDIFWIFNIGQNITIQNTLLRNCLKILFIEDKTDNRIIDDEVTVDNDIFTDFKAQLQEINHALPRDCQSVSIKEDDKLVTYNISYLGV